MNQEFDGTKIIVNYMNDAIGTLFKDIPVLPAIMAFPSYSRGEGLTQDFKVPFKFLDNLDMTHKVNPAYNSRKDFITFGGSMSSRMIDMYGVTGTRHLVRQPSLIHTEYIEDTISSKNKMMIYGISRPKSDSWMSPELLRAVNALWKSTLVQPFDSFGNYLPIMTNDAKSIASLYKHVDVFPAKINGVPRELKKNNPLEFIVYFDIDNSKDTRITGVEYNVRLNDSTTNRLMYLLDIHTHYGFIDKEINVHASYIERLKKLVICGISPKDALISI